MRESLLNNVTNYMIRYPLRGAATTVSSLLFLLGQTTFASGALTVGITPPAGTINEGTAASYKFTTTGAPPYAWVVDWGDGKPPSSFSATTVSHAYTHSYDDDGAYTITATVTDRLGQTGSGSVSVTVANVPPTANAGGPYSGPNGVPMTLMASATDPSPVDMAAGFTYTWDFGNGDVEATTATTISHTFLTAGTFTVYLTATDMDGAVSKRAAATVTAGILSMSMDVIPDFGANPTVKTVKSGNWSDPTIWSTGKIPSTGDIVDITSPTSVTYDMVSSAHLNTVEVLSGADLNFRTDINTQMTVGNFLVLPSATLEIGTQSSPIQANVTAKIIIADQALDTTVDPRQFGTGFIGLGKIRIFGSAKTPTFSRLAKEPKAGDTTLTLADPVSGWNNGDRLILPDTRQLDGTHRGSSFVPQWEELTLQSVSSDGKTITLTTPLGYDHLGAYDIAGTLQFLPHVMNLRASPYVHEIL